MNCKLLSLSLLTLSITVTANAMADANYHYVCTQVPDVRLVEVAYLVPEQKVPCEVRYQKENDQSRILWRADNQEGFCELQAQNFIEKQREWGFECKSENAPNTRINLSFQNYNNL